MADEATVRWGLRIRNGNLLYNRSGQYQADVSGTFGPTPGAIAVSASGTDVSFSQLTALGFAVFTNLSEDYAVEIGPYDPDTDMFYPTLELLPGETIVVRLATSLNMESTGTGTMVGYNSSLRARGKGGTVSLQVEGFNA